MRGEEGLVLDNFLLLLLLGLRLLLHELLLHLAELISGACALVDNVVADACRATAVLVATVDALDCGRCRVLACDFDTSKSRPRGV